MTQQHLLRLVETPAPASDLALARSLLARSGRSARKRYSIRRSRPKARLKITEKAQSRVKTRSSKRKKTLGSKGVKTDESRVR